MEKFLQAVKDFQNLIQHSRGSPYISLLAGSEKDMRTAYKNLQETMRIEALEKASEIMEGVENKAGFGAWLKLDLAEILKKNLIEILKRNLAERLKRKENKT